MGYRSPFIIIQQSIAGVNGMDRMVEMFPHLSANGIDKTSVSIKDRLQHHRTGLWAFRQSFDRSLNRCKLDSTTINFFGQTV